jgi:hypothetical protein
MSVMRTTRRIAGSSADAWGERHFGAWARGLSADEKLALGYYNTPGQYFGINYFNRFGALHPDHRKHSPLGVQEIEQFTRSLDAALGRAAIPEDVLGYRVMQLPPELQEAFERGDLAGRTLEDRAHMSITVDRATALDYELKKRKWTGAPPTVVDIRIPAGTPGAYISTVVGNEREILLARFSTLHFLESTIDENGVQRAVAEVVRSEPDVDRRLRAELMLLGIGLKTKAPLGRFGKLIGDGCYAAERVARGAPFGLTKDETAVAIAYCAGDCSLFNDPLRKKGRWASTPMAPAIRALDRALAKLPRHAGIVHRFEVPYEGGPDYRPGAIVHNAGYVSTSRHPFSVPEPVILIEIDTISGRDVSALSGYQKEEEVVIPRGARFLVESRESIVHEDGRRYVHVKLKELRRSGLMRS